MSFDYQTAFHEGHAFNCYVADILRHFGVPDVQVPEMWDADKPQESLDKTINEKDILVGDLVLEVKSRNLVFQSYEDFPYSDIMIDTVQGFDLKAIKPFAYIMVSQKTGKMFSISTASKSNWITKRVHDPYRNIDYDAYFANKRQCRPFIELVDILLEIASDRTSKV